MHKLRQAIVVEGKYDANALRQLIDAPVFETGGFRGIADAELIALLRAAARARGLIILTDSDGAGFVIRNRLKSALAGENVLHAYIPDIYGKEHRKAAPGKEGKLGVEGMRPEVLLAALKNAGAELDGESTHETADPITKADLYAAGLSGTPDAHTRRTALLRSLGLPEHLGANAFLQALRLLMTREEFTERYCSFGDTP